MKRRLAVSTAFLLAACDTQPTTESAFVDAPVPPAISLSSRALPNCQNVTVSFTFNRRYNCGTPIRVYSSVSQLSSAIPGAIGAWNSAVLSGNGLPYFTTSTVTNSVRVVWGNLYPSGGTPGWYCGWTSDDGDTVMIHRSVQKADCGRPSTPLSHASESIGPVLTHELGHAFGFSGHKYGQNSSGTPSSHCMMALPLGGVINSDVCQHEVQDIYYVYGMRQFSSATSKHIATSVLIAPGTVSLMVGQSAPLVVEAIQFDRGNHDVIGFEVAPTTETFAWSAAPSGVASVGATSAANNTVNAVSAGNAVVSVTLATSNYETAAQFGGGANVTVTAPPTPPAGPPTNITKSGVTSTGATISWTNGDVSSGITTHLEYQAVGAVPWTAATGSGGLPSGQSSFQLTGLAANTAYSVRMYHRRDGLNSAVTLATSLFTTAAPPPLAPPSSFAMSSCEQSMYGSKYYNNWTLAWSPVPSNPGVSYEIREASVNNPASGYLVASGKANAGSAVVGPYLDTSSINNRYFWVRFVQSGAGTAWVPLTGNPLDVAGPCAA